ncbi:hypothetical protein EJ04DRAFT_538829 [Polyplosphaeria fusca]|uniref:SIMPL domain-containing protein n=1 Tax=Polyplosphaeria fusca TaxID=682080 RepID=A0A9P4QHZ3_9PLEO|nr:hypothetical protein EJ04DRAFT_538829 [Polyplosphaeria fusca]
MSSSQVLEIQVQGTGYNIRPAEPEATAVVAAATSVLHDEIMPYCPQDEEGRTLPDAAIAHYSMTTLDTTSNQQRRDREGTFYEPTYSARVELHIKFADFDVLNILATKFSAMDNIKIQRIEWKLTDATYEDIQTIARKAAAQSAIQKAYDYAETFAGVPAEDLKMRVIATELHNGKKRASSQMQETRVNQMPLRFKPEDMRLEARVHATFKVKQ